MLSLKTLYDATMSTYRLRLIAGKDGMNRTVSWMYYAEDTAAIEFLRGGEIAVTTGLCVERRILNTGDGEHSSAGESGFAVEFLDSLVNELFSCNASGLIVNTGKYIDTIPQEIIALCDRLSFPLLTMPWEIHTIDLMQDFGNRIVSDRQKGFSITQAFGNALFHPEKFEIGSLENTSFSAASRFGIALLEIPNEFLGNDERLSRYLDHSLTIRIRIPPANFCWLSYDKKIVFILTGDIESAANLIRKAAAQDKYFTGMRLALSGICDCPQKLTREYVHAELALKFCRAPDIFCSYDSLGIYRLFAEIEDRRILEKMYSEILGAFDVLPEDKRNDYLNTLRLYIESGGKIQKTAEKNFAHRNTVNYRIRRITEILGADLQDGKTRYMIQSALYIRELLARL